MLFYRVVEDDFITCRNVEVIVLQRAKANLWPLQVLQNSDSATNSSACLANPRNLIKPLFVRAVAKVEAKTVGARPDQRFYFLWCVGGWPQSSQYLCTFCRIIHCVHIIAA